MSILTKTLHLFWYITIVKEEYTRRLKMEYINQHPKQLKIIAQAVLLIAAISFICFGAYRGEVESVFSKAIRLCLECVGIG